MKKLKKLKKKLITEGIVGDKNWVKFWKKQLKGIKNIESIQF